MLGDLLNWLRLSASAGRSFRTPTLEESLDNSATPFGVRLANAGLVPETAWTYDAGLEVHTDSHTVRATVYRSSVRNLIQSLYVTSTTFQSSNVADGERQGIELQIHHVWAKNLESGLRYRYADVQGRPSGFSERVLLAYSPRHIVSHSLLIRPSQKTRIDSNLQFVDKQFSGNAQTGDKLSNRLIWDLRFGVNVLQAEFYIGARNITDRRYVEQPGFPLVGRTLYGGVQLKLWD